MNVRCSFPGRIRLSQVSEHEFTNLYLTLNRGTCAQYCVTMSYNPRNHNCLLLFDSSQISVADLLQFIADKRPPAKIDDCKTHSPVVSSCVPQPQNEPTKIFNIVRKSTLFYLVNRWLIPPCFRPIWAVCFMAPHILKGAKSFLKGRIDMDVLEACSLLLSFIYGNYNTVNTVNLLLDVSDQIDTSSKQKAYERHQQNMIFGCGKLWVKDGAFEAQKAICQVEAEDLVVVHPGMQMVVDGFVVEGEAWVDEFIITGERALVSKKAGSRVFAGSYLKDGQLTILSSGKSSESRLAQLSSKALLLRKDDVYLKNKAVRIANKLAPFSFVLSFLVFLFTRNVRYATALLMIDYSCAFKLAVPIGLHSAVRDSYARGILLKSERSLEKLAQIDTVILTCEGVLTQKIPKLVGIHTVEGQDENEILRKAACVEEHLPHRIAKAIVNRAIERDLLHEESHTPVEYILSHGVATKFNGVKFMVGNEHFLEDDEGIDLSSVSDYVKTQKQLGHKLLYVASDSQIVAVFSLEDPLRENVTEFLTELDHAGIKRIILLGKGKRETERIAQELGIDEYYCHHTPHARGDFIKKLQQQGRKIAFLGEGLRDAQSFRESRVAVSMSHSGSIVGEACDIMLQQNELMDFVEVLYLSRKAMKRVRNTVGTTLAVNTSLFVLRIMSILTPGNLSILHNLATAVACGLNTKELSRQDTTAEKMDMVA